MTSLANDLLVITVSVLSLGAFVVILYWLYHRYFVSRIRYAVYVDDGLRLRKCPAEPVEVFVENGIEWLRLKTKCFDHDVVVPRKSFRIFSSRLHGSWIAYIVDGKGSPKAWSTDTVENALTYDAYRRMVQESEYMRILTGVLRSDVLKFMVLVVIASLVVLAIALLFQPSPHIVVNIPQSNTTTITPPPPPGIR